MTLHGLQLPVALSAPDLLDWADTLDLTKLHDGKSPAAIVYLVHAWFERARPLLSPRAEDWKDARVLVLADVQHAGVGDRIMQAMIAHAAQAAGANVTILWSVPAQYQDLSAHRHAREIVHWFYPDVPLKHWGYIRAVPDEQVAPFTRLEDFDLVLAMTHCGDYAYTVDRQYETMHDAVLGTLKLDLASRQPYRAPPRDLRLPEKYIVVQTSAKSFPEACGPAIKLAREMAKREKLPLVLLGFNDGRDIKADVDLRNADFATTVGAVKYAFCGAGPDSALAHAAGFYGVPWIAVSSFKKSVRPRWWSGGYRSVQLVDVGEAHRRVAELLGWHVVQST